MKRIGRLRCDSAVLGQTYERHTSFGKSDMRALLSQVARRMHESAGLFGIVLTVPHAEGATYCDEWNGINFQPELRDGQAMLSPEHGSQSMGCITQRLNAERQP